MSCPTCGSKGFERSVIGPDRCTFCDGTEGGNPPTTMTANELAKYLRDWFPVHAEFSPARKERYGKIHEAAAMLEAQYELLRHQEETIVALRNQIATMAAPLRMLGPACSEQ